jgi:hypothetical protein
MARVAIQGGALLGGSPQGSNMSVTGYWNASDGSAQIVYLRSIYATELSFTGGVTGFTILRGGCVLRYLLITGSQSIGTPPPGGVSYYYGWGSGMEVYDRIFIDGCSWWGFGNMGWYVSAGSIEANTSLSIAISFCGATNARGGVECDASWVLLRVSEFIVTSCNGPAIIQYAGTFGAFSKCYIAGCDAGSGLGAITMENGGSLWWETGGIITTNNGAAVWNVGGTYVGEGMSYTYNTVGGVIAIGPCYCAITDSVVSGNGGNGVQANGNSYIDASRSSLQSATPAPNTEGNYGAWIIN